MWSCSHSFVFILKLELSSSSRSLSDSQSDLLFSGFWHKISAHSTLGHHSVSILTISTSPILVLKLFHLSFLNLFRSGSLSHKDASPWTQSRNNAFELSHDYVTFCELIAIRTNHLIFVLPWSNVHKTTFSAKCHFVTSGNHDSIRNEHAFKTKLLSMKENLIFVMFEPV